MHQREHWRPSSTGHLICRALDGVRTHLYRRGQTVDATPIRDAGRALWILHPRGEPIEACLTPDVAPGCLQVLLIDGNWNEAGEMLRLTEGWGRRVSLHLDGPSRYWLREQSVEGRHSTMEALLEVFRVLGLWEIRERLRLHFELHVYASLRARGQKELAARFLAESPLASALPEAIAELDRRRPNLVTTPAPRRADTRRGGLGMPGKNRELPGKNR